MEHTYCFVFRKKKNIQVETEMEYCEATMLGAHYEKTRVMEKDNSAQKSRRGQEKRKTK